MYKNLKYLTLIFLYDKMKKIFLEVYPKMDKVKVAIIGCGGIGSWHFSHLIQFDDVDLVGFCDLVIERAENFAKQYGRGKTFAKYTEMLDEVKPDVVYICVEPCAHGDIEMAVIERGIPFLVEKPMALDMAMAEKICAAAAEKNLITAVGFQDRYLDLTDKMKEYLVGKKVGLVTGAWVGGIPGVWWWRKRSTSGGQIVEQNIHIYDMARYLFGEPVSIYCGAGKGIVEPDSSEYNVPGYDVEDYSSAVITFENGVVATIYTACYTVQGGGMRSGMNIYCKNATIEYTLRSGVKYRDAETVEETVRQADQGVTEDRTFIDAIKSGDGSAIRSPYSDALKSLRLCLAANESIDTGKVIQL